MATVMSLEEAYLISGNASIEIKQNIANPLVMHTNLGLGLGDAVGIRPKLTEASFNSMAE